MLRRISIYCLTWPCETPRSWINPSRVWHVKWLIFHLRQFNFQTRKWKSLVIRDAGLFCLLLEAKQGLFSCAHFGTSNLYQKIIGWVVRASRMGPLWLGPRGWTDGVGQYKTPGMRDSNPKCSYKIKYSPHSTVLFRTTMERHPAPFFSHLL